MSRYIITPWRTHSDLLQVRDQLFQPPTPSDQRHAIARIQAWKLRGNLPHAVESTALLLEAQLHHAHTLQAPSTPPKTTTTTTTPATTTTSASSLQASDFSIRAVYTAAFTRFVTGFCDIGRHKERSLEPSSMLKIAQQIGMPEEFVALRHEATHEELPGLRRLVVATERALAWLWAVYWVGLEGEQGVEREGDAVDLSGLRDEARRVLKGWRSARVRALSTKTAGKQAHVEEREKAVQSCVELCEGGKGKVEALVSVLVDDRLMLPSDPEYVFTSRISFYRHSLTIRSAQPINGAFLVWDGLIFELLERLQGFAGILIQALLVASSEQFPATDGARMAFCWWVYHLIEQQHSQERAYQWSSRAMKHCCLYPGGTSQELGQRVLDGADVAFREVWGDIFAASKLREAGSATDAPRPQGREASVEDSDDTSTDSMQQDTESGGWSRAVLPPSVPIGVVA
ncbi:hypothetical protein MBLNU230_g0069t1 [Neophaeotheca triangularis]